MALERCNDTLAGSHTRASTADHLLLEFPPLANSPHTAGTVATDQYAHLSRSSIEGVLSWPYISCLTDETQPNRPHTFNAIPVRRCGSRASNWMAEVHVKVTDYLQPGDDIFLLQDDETHTPCVLQCSCGGVPVCKYELKCTCSNGQCAWPQRVHDGRFDRTRFTA
jgi:hypothetical protein